MKRCVLLTLISTVRGRLATFFRWKKRRIVFILAIARKEEAERVKCTNESKE